MISRFNDRVALWLTRRFGTMWVFYGFTLFGLLPVLRIFHPFEAQFLYWSNWVQLWALPLLLVGTNILARSIETRAQADHEKLAEMHRQILATLESLRRQDIVLAAQTEAMVRDKPDAT